MPYHSIEDPAKLRRVVEATLLLEADLDLPSLLRHIIDEARSMTNARYGAIDRLWSGNPNAQLVTEATDLDPATALDVGCGEGADAIWLAPGSPATVRETRRGRSSST